MLKLCHIYNKITESYNNNDFKNCILSKLANYFLYDSTKFVQKQIATFAFYCFLKFYNSKLRETKLNINDNYVNLLSEVKATIKHKVKDKIAKSLKYINLEFITD